MMTVGVHAVGAVVQPHARSRTERAASLPALTGLRFLAALVVVIDHTGYGPVAAMVAPFGGVAVTLFFILSGFILTYTYTRNGTAVHGGWRAFYSARIARVYPLYLLGCAAGSVPFFVWHTTSLAACIPGAAGAQALATLLLVQAWSPTAAQCLNAPGWSVSAEAFFYLLFPLAALLLNRCTPERLMLALGLLWALCLLPPSLIIAAHPTGTTAVLWQRAAYFGPLLRFPTFLLGMAAGRLFTHGVRLRAASLWAPATLLGVVWLPSLLAGMGAALTEAALVPLLALLVFALAHGRGLGAALLAHPISVALGEASYAIYIIHLPLHDWMSHGTGRLGFWLYSAVLLVIALLIHRIVERPARRAIRRSLDIMVHGAGPGTYP
jgi:peptidoglycan/LPS O-acetylase OafA/YrhL